jgi:replicative DNA helicase
MPIPLELTSLNLERTILGGFYNHPESIIELSHVVSEKEFSNRAHNVIFSVMKNTVLNGQKLEKVILSQRITELGIRLDDGLDIFSYLDDLSFTQIQPKGITEIAKELIKLRIKRDLWVNAETVQSYIKDSHNDSIDKIISNVDSIYNKQIDNYRSDDIPCDIFNEAESIINDRVINSNKFTGIQTPFPIFHDMFGSLKTGITAICGRAKNNKSTILLNIGWGSILTNPDLKVIYLDTELKKHDHVFRSMAAFSQVNASYLDDGSWAKNLELVNKLKESWKSTNELKGKLHHYYIGNRPIEEIISVIKKWYFNTCHRGHPGLVILDYIKIGDEKLSNYNGEHQELGRKINALNALSQELNLPILSSMQLNRSAITDQREDESAISMTDRLSWFANGVFIFRKKRADEISEEGIGFGTHKLIPVVLRYQGKNTGLLDLVRTDSGQVKATYKQNFINYNFSNFLLQERGTLRDIIRQKNLQLNLQSGNVNTGNSI